MDKKLLSKNIAKENLRLEFMFDTMLVPYRVRIGLHGGLHRQGSVTGAQGVVLMRHRGTKQRHDAVAQYLVHRPFKAVYGVYHNVNRRVEELLSDFGVEVQDQLGRVFDISKQDRDLLAFTFRSR